ncbi:MAG TPA: hypothetical protein VJA21_14755 [Verrucomicrobiae bacterium]
MNQADPPSTEPSPETRRGRLGRHLRRVFIGAFILDLLLVWARLIHPGWLVGDSQIAEGVLVILGVAATLAAFLGELPAQNLLLASLLIAGISVAADSLTAKAGLPLAGGQHAGISDVSLVWAPPLIRVFEILNSRGLARLVLRPQRQNANYGFWVLGLTVLLAVAFEMNLGPLATFVSGCSSGKPEYALAGWHSTSCLALGVRALAALLTVAVVTPSLIDKRPNSLTAAVGGNRDSVGLFSFWGWASSNFLFLTVATTHGLWLAAMLIAIELLLLIALVLIAESKSGAGRVPERQQ